jgi:hypothetical protein
MTTRTRTIWLAVGSLSILAWASAASAQWPARHGEGRREHARSETRVQVNIGRPAVVRPPVVVEQPLIRLRSEADIERLSGDLRWVAGQWDLQVAYKVEIENMCPWERFEAVFRVAENGIPLLDTNGQPMTITIPLERPTDIDHDELEFEDSFGLCLPDGAICDANNIRVYAKIVRIADGRVLDREDDSICCVCPRPARVIVRDVRRTEIVRHTNVAVRRTVRVVRASAGGTIVRTVPVAPVAVVPVAVPYAAAPVAVGSGLHIGVGVSVRH